MQCSDKKVALAVQQEEDAQEEIMQQEGQIGQTMQEEQIKIETEGLPQDQDLQIEEPIKTTEETAQEARQEDEATKIEEEIIKEEIKPFKLLNQTG